MLRLIQAVNQADIPDASSVVGLQSTVVFNTYLALDLALVSAGLDIVALLLGAGGQRCQDVALVLGLPRLEVDLQHLTEVLKVIDVTRALHVRVLSVLQCDCCRLKYLVHVFSELCLPFVM